MKKIDIIIGVLVSAGLHGGVLWGGELFNVAKQHVAKAGPAEDAIVAAQIDFEAPEEQPKPEEQQPEEQEEQDVSDSDSSGDLAAASLPEPMNTVGVSDITTVIKPQPPVAPKAESTNWAPPSKTTRAIDSSKFKEFVDFAKLDKKPQARSQTPPRYPFELKRQGIQGECTVQFFVDENGVVSDPVVVSSTHQEFQKPCIDAVMQWRFSPGMKNGRKVATRMQQAFPFKLN
ncbi:MAG TPA: energy transducer TonB [Opitutaceae bacterium]|nr:energy transducer TonB [Opitutaceae bacterium]